MEYRRINPNVPPKGARKNDFLRNEPRCDCPNTANERSLIENGSLAMAYVLWQHWHEVYPLEKALECGTLFPELNKPFTGRC